MAQYLVTGGAGFIGSHMVEALMCMDLQKILQREISPLFGPPQPGDIRHDYAGIERARRVLSYQPFWDIDEGLRETVAWYQKGEERMLREKKDEE